ncbi:MAG: Gfo/Idh/MocA family oxidoreductase, partial [Acidobacteriota bacterium]
GIVTRVFDPEPGNGNGYERARHAVGIVGANDVDAVFVCTPNYFTQPLVIDALRAGKHVFAEKPPAFTATGVEQIISAERMAGDRRLMFGFNHRHHESIKRAKALIDSGDFGRLLWIRGRYGKSVDDQFLKSWRARKKLVGGGILLDQGIHMLDLFLHFAGDFDEVQAQVSNLFWNLEGIEDNVFAQLRNRKSGVCASLHSTMTQWRHIFSLEIFLERGNILVHGLITSSGTYGDEILTVAHNLERPPVVRWEPEQQYTYRTDTSWASEVDHFFKAIREKRPVEFGSSTDALRLMRIVDRIYGRE